MPYRDWISIPEKTFFVRAGYTNSKPYYTTRALAIADAVSGDTIINWGDTTTYTPKVGVKVVDIHEYGSNGVLQRVIGNMDKPTLDIEWTESYTDFSTPLLIDNIGTGQYALSLTDAFGGFVIPKDLLITDPLGTLPTIIGRVIISKLNSDTVLIETYNVAGNLVNDIANGTVLTIEHIILP